MSSTRATRDSAAPPATILILSPDAVGAALIGALIETLGYGVAFVRPSEQPDDAIRRVRPRIALFDCNDPVTCNAEVAGRAIMRGIAVFAFGTSEAIDRLEKRVPGHPMIPLRIPATVTELHAAFAHAASPSR